MPSLVTTHFGIPILSILLIVPTLAAILVLAVRDVAASRRIAISSAVLGLGLAFAALLLFVKDLDSMQLVETGLRLPIIGVRYRLGVDGLSILLLPMTAGLTLSVLLSAPRYELDRGYLAAVLLLEAATLGIFEAMDLGVFLAFSTFALLPGFFLVATHGSSATRERAASIYGAYLLAGSIPLVFAVMMLGHEGRAQGLDTPFDLLELQRVGIPAGVQATVFTLVVVFVLVRSFLFPFHSWLPMTVEEGPLGIGVMLASVHVGAYTLARIAFPLLPVACSKYMLPLQTLAMITILYGALLAYVQRGLRRKIAFMAISQSGLIMLGLAAHDTEGLAGAMLQGIAVGSGIAGLLLLTWALEGRTGSRLMQEFGGLIRTTPQMATFFFVFGIASVGFPGSLSFVGEDLLMHGAFAIHPIIAAVGLLGPALNGYTILHAWSRTFLGGTRRDDHSSTARGVEDLLPREQIVGLMIALVSIGGGIVPQSLLSVQHAAILRMHPQDETQEGGAEHEAREGRHGAAAAGEGHHAPGGATPPPHH